MNLSPTQQRRESGDAVLDRVNAELDEMTRRGDFGHPPDLQRLLAAQRELINRYATIETKSQFHDICGLWQDMGWHADRPKVLLSCSATREGVVIPKGAKILVLKNNPQPNTQQPFARLVYLTHDVAHDLSPAGPAQTIHYNQVKLEQEDAVSSK
ncbi:unnamed product [Ostreococcus tauri]|uniref:Unnamed product n=1 Tax=Ostreococcus tauri TaxID=70448 RepID=Q00X30_OSTTA|nr:unnamed product [Ostreococcus tauri]OUS46257.1 hypothetical protein BE221DRAFT_192248 [Ostreococcus tauri]CAL56481.1 unnamed product [Ostreococcus tauri]|eukprot:XP_003082624.1 unnamed product [Ostreococcus tauri]